MFLHKGRQALQERLKQQYVKLLNTFVIHLNNYDKNKEGDYR